MEEYTFNVASLKNIFKLAVDVDAKYVAVLIQMDGFEKEEIIINPIENAVDKLGYYLEVYDFDCVHKHSRGVRIVSATFGDSFGAIEYELLGL